MKNNKKFTLKKLNLKNIKISMPDFKKIQLPKIKFPSIKIDFSKIKTNLKKIKLKNKVDLTKLKEKAEKLPKPIKVKEPKIKKVKEKFSLGLYTQQKVEGFNHFLEKAKKPFVKVSQGMEMAFKNPRTLKVVSFIIAALIFSVVMIRGRELSLGSSGGIIKDVPVNIIYNSETYVVEGAPEKVDLYLIGSRSDINLIKAMDKYEVYMDLTNLGPGSHTVQLEYKNISSKVQTKIEPSAVKIKISNNISRTVNVTYDLVRLDKKDPKLNIDSVKLSRDKVTVRGAEDKINSIVTVRALVDASKVEREGVNEVDDIPLIAYDENGQVVNVTIEHTKISAEIKASESSKEVPIEVIPKGTLAEGYSITNVETNISTVKVYAPQDILNNLTSIPVEVDVTELSKNKQFEALIEMPTGVTFISEEKVEVKVTLDKTASKELTLKIVSKNIPSGYVVNALTEEDNKATIVIKGSESILSQINESTDDIKIYVDLDGLTAGEHSVELQVEINNQLVTEHELKKFKVNIVLTKKE